MGKISKVKNVQGAGTWESQHGLMFKFDYEFEDGTVMQAMHKSENHFNVGDEVEYEVKRENEFGKSGKVSKPQQNNFQGGGFKGKTGGNASFAASYSKDIEIALINSGKEFDEERMFKVAGHFLKWLNQNQ